MYCPEALLRNIEYMCTCFTSAELKGSGKLLRIRPKIFDFGPDWGLKASKTKPKIGTVPKNWHTKIPNNSGPISACFDEDPKL